MTVGGRLQPMPAVLLLEACRLADRLDKLDGQLRGEDRGWLDLAPLDEEGARVEVIVDRALSEARQQAVALKTLLGEIRQAGAKNRGKPPRATGARPAETTAEAEGEQAKGAGAVADIASWVANRRSSSAG